MKKQRDDNSLKQIAYERAGIERRLRERYFNLFASAWKWSGFEREEREAIIRALWEAGTISAFRIADGLLAFTPYAPQEFNLYNTPITAIPVPGRMAPYIPTKPLHTGVLRPNQARRLEEPEIVLGWAQHTYRPIRDSLKDWIDDLVEVEMAIRVNTDLQKVPFAIKSTTQDESKLKNLVSRAIYGSRQVTIGVSDADSIEAFSTGAPYLLDKLEERKDHLDKEVLTFLGIDNLKEKPERMQGDEINANNDEININRDAILDNVKEWIEKVNEGFGTAYRVEPKASARSLYEKENKEGQEDGNPESNENRME